MYESDDERNEPMLNKKIADNVRDFIFRFGQDFMFISPNYRIQAGDEEKFVCGVYKKIIYVRKI